jgi:glycosyltransferase involved in cell wall biosynthesis
LTNLSVIIPTHNGSQFLFQTLEALTLQITTLDPKKIEIIVVESGSDAEEAKEISVISTTFGVKLVPHEENLGYDRNILRAISQSNSDFFWLCGDDDLARDGCVQELMSRVENRGFDVAIFSTIDALEQGVSDYPGVSIEKTEDLELFDEICKNPFLGSAMSQCVFRRDAFLAIDLSAFVGLDWIHQSAILQMAVHQRNFKVARLNSNVFVRQPGDRWKSHFGSQYLAGLRQLHSSSLLEQGARSDAVYKSFRAKRFASNLMDALTLGYSLTWPERIWSFKFTRKHFGREPRFWFLDVPVLFVFCLAWPAVARIARTARNQVSGHKNPKEHPWSV